MDKLVVVAGPPQGEPIRSFHDFYVGKRVASLPFRLSNTGT
jgi:hypothetical protein